ncbi:NAD-dependent epimerase/dehydratase family protein [Sinomicrobium weinanense]|uniref:SDR family oxidoreductase n=1 Tax=Sinomicrobium weinanense TaxID=2842200 RepID=A0A926JVG0_9FLAO|nr:NAD-dependent epimerase/dehydratase family protein [Sinomicrobium weinanense]MBC9797901.1 SDR family oxidoreductase [Sinomicrobium weinanense]MBU3125438.1 SDR family oxidoreductase [Sinomicrobium weinanense]
MILVTGGTGLIGARLLYSLSRKEEKIRAVYRKGSDIDAVAGLFSASEEDRARFGRIEWVEADITDIPALSNAFEGVRRVYHAAALISFDPSDYYLLKKTNTEGTANVVNLCIANAVEKLCYVSSVATLSKKVGEEFITEEAQWNMEEENNVYAISKYGAEMEVWRGSQEGLDVVIVNPGIVLGVPPGIAGWNKGSGRLFQELDKGMKYYTEGVTGYVDAEDVVAIMIRLMNSDIKNEKYIAVSENRSYRELFAAIARALGKEGPKKEVPAWALQWLWRLDWLKSLLTGSKRKITRLLARTITSKNLYSSDKVKEELGLEFRPLSETITFVGKNYVSSVKKGTGR